MFQDVLSSTTDFISDTVQSVEIFFNIGSVATTASQLTDRAFENSAQSSRSGFYGQSGGSGKYQTDGGSPVSGVVYVPRRSSLIDPDPTDFLNPIYASTKLVTQIPRGIKYLLGLLRGGKKVVTVLGKNPDYIKLADKLGANRFSIPQSVWNRMTEAEKWNTNKNFLDLVVKRGDDIVLSNPVKNVNDVTGFFRKELDYLIEKGFRLSDDGTRVVR